MKKIHEKIVFPETYTSIEDMEKDIPSKTAYLSQNSIGVWSAYSLYSDARFRRTKYSLGIVFGAKVVNGNDKKTYLKVTFLDVFKAWLDQKKIKKEANTDIPFPLSITTQTICGFHSEWDKYISQNLDGQWHTYLFWKNAKDRVCPKHYLFESEVVCGNERRVYSKDMFNKLLAEHTEKVVEAGVQHREQPVESVIINMDLSKIETRLIAAKNEMSKAFQRYYSCPVPLSEVVEFKTKADKKDIYAHTPSIQNKNKPVKSYHAPTISRTDLENNTVVQAVRIETRATLNGMVDIPFLENLAAIANEYRK